MTSWFKPYKLTLGQDGNLAGKQHPITESLLLILLLPAADVAAALPELRLCVLPASLCTARLTALYRMLQPTVKLLVDGAC
jgi:hypothetical protein